MSLAEFGSRRPAPQIEQAIRQILYKKPTLARKVKKTGSSELSPTETCYRKQFNPVSFKLVGCQEKR